MNKKLETLLRKFNLVYASVLVLLFLVSVFFMAFNNYNNKISLAQTISHIIEENLKSNQLREVMKVLSSARFDEFKAISYYKADGTRLVTFPPNIDPSYFQNQSWIDNLYYQTFEVNLFFDQKKDHKLGSIRFSIDPYKSVPMAALFWAIFALLLLPIVRSHKKLIIKNFEQESMNLKIKAVREVQRQVKHDSRGAIQAIKAVIDSSRNLDQLELTTLKSATKRLEDMISESRNENINTEEHKIEKQKEALTHVFTALNDIVTEKRVLMERDSIDTEFTYNQKALSIFLKLDEIHFKRIVSNIIDNSIQAIKELDVIDRNKDRFVKIHFEATQDHLKITFLDSGVGIKGEHLPFIGIKGYTLKKQGSGLGISWAKEKISEWNGDLSIKSEYLKGTTIAIELPIMENPVWAVESLDLKNISNIVAIDDDPSMIDHWKKRFLNSSQHQFGFFGFESGEDFFKMKVLPGNTLYFIDYDLSQGQSSYNGLQIASLMKDRSHVYIVTNNFDDWEIQKSCRDLGLKLLPKTILQFSSS